MALNLIRCFSGKEGYMDYDDAIPTCLLSNFAVKGRDKLTVRAVKYLAHEAKVRTAVVSNADSRIRK